jgi:hypothetical protein
MSVTVPGNACLSPPRGRISLFSRVMISVFDAIIGDFDIPEWRYFGTGKLLNNLVKGEFSQIIINMLLKGSK